jgi:hypothetical protein
MILRASWTFPDSSEVIHPSIYLEFARSVPLPFKERFSPL